jgi:hypothetical protein
MPWHAVACINDSGSKLLSVTDDSTGEGLGDIGIYDFDAYSDFPDHSIGTT